MKLNQTIGLGDIAYWAFRPVVYLIDWIWGTDMRNCELCKVRRQKWNSEYRVPIWAIISLTVSLVAIAYFS